MPVQSVNFASLLSSTSRFCLSYILPGNTIPPIYRLPDEILSEIFKYLLFSPDHQPQQVSPHSPVVSTENCITPFLLSHVSKDFHNVVTKNPALWASIAFVYPLPRRHDLTKLWLSYSRNLPLDITLIEDETEGEYEAMVQLFDLLIEHVERWRAIDLCLIRGIPSSFIEVLSTRSLSSLQYVEVDTEFDTNEVANIAFKAFLTSKSVHTLIWGSPVHSPPMRYGAHLKFLELDLPIPIGQLIANLANCPNLVCLDVGKIHHPLPIISSTLPIHLPRLRVLTLSLVSDDDDYSSPNRDRDRALVPLLSVLTAPRLTHLNLNGVAD
ncbi:hypothetical protein BDN70DRAFT_916356, partial [Pholiota conissans]